MKYKEIFTDLYGWTCGTVAEVKMRLAYQKIYKIIANRPWSCKKQPKVNASIMKLQLASYHKST